MAHLGERIGPHTLMIGAAVGSIVSTALYGLVESAAVQVFARLLWGISFAALNLSTLAYAVSDRANAGKRVGYSRATIGVVQACSAGVGGAWLALNAGCARGVRDLWRDRRPVARLPRSSSPRLPPRARDEPEVRLPLPHRLEIWGFLLEASLGDGVFLLTLAF